MTTIRLGGVAPAGEETSLLQYFAMCGVVALTTYSACDLRCSYCVSYAQGPSDPRVHPDEVAAQVRRELQAFPPDAVIGVGSLIDGYPHAEARWGATRRALEVLVEEGRQLVITTKGDAILRDLDLFAGYPHVAVNVSLPALDPVALRTIEPKVPPPARRLEVVEALHAAGIPVQIHVQPWTPGLTDAEAMIAAGGGTVPVCFGPLNVQSRAMPHGGPYAHLSQADINEAYVAEYQRIGPRPGVLWQRPAWLGPRLLEAMSTGTVPRPDRCGPGPADGAVDPRAWFERVGEAPGAHSSHEATVRRLVAAHQAGAAAYVTLEIVSPFIRGHDASGLLGDAAHPASGYFEDALTVVRSALDDVQIGIASLEPDGDRVHGVVRVSGIHRRPLLGAAPTGGPVAVTLALTWRFDGNGMLVEYWQDLHEIHGFTPARPSPAAAAV